MRARYESLSREGRVAVPMNIFSMSIATPPGPAQKCQDRRMRISRWADGGRRRRSGLLAPRRIGFVAAVLALLALPLPSRATDWPQFLGPDRNGVYSGGDLAEQWPSGGPQKIWEKKIGSGFSNSVVANGRLILFHRVGNDEVVDALDAASGKGIWSYKYPTAYQDDFGFDPGPRASPLVNNGKVYTFGAEGVLTCLDFESGKKIWSVATKDAFGVRKGFFGAASAPLVQGSRLFSNVGGGKAGLVAFDKDTGKVLWTSTNDEASYSSPVAANFGGKSYIIFFTRNGLVAVEPGSGKVEFQHSWRSRSRASVNAAVPLVVGNQIFLSASYGTGAALFRFDSGTLTRIWSSDDALSNHYATSVHHDGYLYGFHGRQEYSQSFRCIELKTGRVRWSEEGFGAGTVTLAGGRLVLLREDGELVLAKASPERFELGPRAKILPGVVRAYPALAGGMLYARNEDTLVCVRLKK
jgi:outer membrane protein assembly factor BamB